MTDANRQQLSKLLNLDFPYDWSNSQMSENTFIRVALTYCRFDDILKVCGHFTIERVDAELDSLRGAGVSQDIIKKTTGIMDRIKRGYELAMHQNTGDSC